MSLRDLSVTAFTQALASHDPTPGGGSASALAGSLACGLVAMVARTTAGSKRFADRAAQMEALAREANQLRADFLVLVDEDAAAFDEVMKAVRLPKGTPEEQAARTKAIQEAYRMAAAPPMKVCDRAVRALELATCVAEHGTPTAASDAGVAGLLAATALQGAALNVRINLGGIKEEFLKSTLADRLRLLQARGEEQAAKVRALVDANLG